MPSNAELRAEHPANIVYQVEYDGGNDWMVHDGDPDHDVFYFQSCGRAQWFCDTLNAVPALLDRIDALEDAAESEQAKREAADMHCALLQQRIAELKSALWLAIHELRAASADTNPQIDKLLDALRGEGATDAS